MQRGARQGTRSGAGVARQASVSGRALSQPTTGYLERDGNRKSRREMTCTIIVAHEI